MKGRDICEWIRLLHHHPRLWCCSWASGGDGSGRSDSQGVGDDGGDGGSGDESKSCWLPANVIRRRRPRRRLDGIGSADDGEGGDGTHGGGCGGSEPDRRRRGQVARPAAARPGAPATRCGENDSARALQDPANL